MRELPVEKSSVIGKTISHYRIVKKLGQGGMGEVFKALDTRLDRSVALKFLPAGITADAERRARFEREARIISQLTHPHICTLYDIGREGDVDFLVMECLEGETLAERLVGGALPVNLALEWAIQIAEALDYAHRRGIVHRDLKPANLMLTRSGIRLLDFGLARSWLPREHTADGITGTPTVTGALTERGAILGTPEYMSPEQIEGKLVDARADIFAFGTIVYEMLSGRRAFEGVSPASVIAAILERDPAPIELVRAPSLELLIRRCLAKDREERWQSIRDVLFELRSFREHPADLTVPAAGIEDIDLRRPVVRFQIPLPQDSVLTPLGAFGTGFQVAVSPDGHRIAFVAGGGHGESLVWVRDLDDLVPRPLAGTEGATLGLPFWSPDSRHLGFFAHGHLYRIAVKGGRRQVLCGADGRGGTWNHNGVILFALGPNSGLFTVSSSGGTPTAVTTLEISCCETSHRFPQFLPDGHHFLFFVFADAEHQGMYLSSLGNADRHLILRSDSNAVYAAPGYLLWVRGGTLLTQAFDGQLLTVSGEPRPLEGGVGHHLGFGQSSVSASNEGTLVYVSGGLTKSELVWTARDGTPQGVVPEAGAYSNTALSPLADALAVEKMDASSGSCDVWLIDLEVGLATRFTSGRFSQRFPVWSPDGASMVFWVDTGGTAELYRKAVGSSSEDENLLASMPGNLLPTDWFPDGRFIVCHTARMGQPLWLVPANGGTPTPLIQTRFTEIQGQISPDGRSLAYVSDESGTFEVYVRDFLGHVGKTRVSHR